MASSYELLMSCKLYLSLLRCNLLIQAFLKWKSYWLFVLQLYEQAKQQSNASVVVTQGCGSLGCGYVLHISLTKHHKKPRTVSVRVYVFFKQGRSLFTFFLQVIFSFSGVSKGVSQKCKNMLNRERERRKEREKLFLNVLEGTIRLGLQYYFVQVACL